MSVENNIRSMASGRQSSSDRARDAIVAWVLEQKLTPGAKLPSQAELVRVLNCSETTVQKAMKSLVDDGIVERRVGAGTFLSRLPIGSTTQPPNVIAICSIDAEAFRPDHSPVFEVIQTAEVAILGQAPDVRTAVRVCADVDALSRFVRETRPAGLLVDWRSAPESGLGIEVRGWLARQSVPAVHCLHYSIQDSLMTHFVAIDNLLIGRMCVDHLADAGHRRIWHIGPDAPYAFKDQRWIGANESAHRRGVQLERVEVGVEQRGDFWLAAGRMIYDRWKTAANRPTGLVAVNDETAIGFVVAARADGTAVPDDVSIIGVDNNMRWQHMHGVSLTTIDPMRPRIGELAAKRLLSRIESGTTDRSMLFVQPRLISRSTCSHPK